MIQEKIGHIIELLSKGLIKEALLEFKLAHEQSPYDIDILKAEMMVRQEHNQLEEFEEVLVAFNSNVETLDSKFLLGYYYFCVGNIKQSLNLFAELCELDDSNHAYLSFWIASEMADKPSKKNIETAIRNYIVNYPQNLEFLLYASAVCDELKLANLKSELQQKLDTFDPKLVNNILESNINSILN
jgi:tetratricopeptide (TPR) repeat protein